MKGECSSFAEKKSVGERTHKENYVFRDGMGFVPTVKFFESYVVFEFPTAMIQDRNLTKLIQVNCLIKKTKPNHE